MMYSQTLSYDSPLYGRRTGQIKMKQIAFRYYQNFFPTAGQRQLIENYAVTGGVPKYIESFELYDNVQKSRFFIQITFNRTVRDVEGKLSV
jgi:AAA+ ATPase superfamily predicted ATPase